jgi:L-gulonate 3-dehydrogenase
MAAKSDVPEGGKIAIIGSGFIGRSWSVLFARAGFNPCLYDIEENQLKTAEESILVWLKSMQDDGLLRGQKAEDVMKRISFQSDLQEAMKNADYMQECVFEDVDLKRKVFTEVDQYASDHTLLVSSTSCIDPAKFTDKLAHKENCIVAHPVNPPHLVPLVEVIPAPYTSPEVVTRTFEILKKIGQSPVLVKKAVNGFILNRLQYALTMEAWRLFEDGVASPEDIDKVMTDGLGLRYSLIGPFETIHLNANGIEDYCKRYGENIVKICEEQGKPRPLSGKTLEEAKKIMEEKIPLDQIGERRKLRDRRLVALACHREEENQST